MCSFESSSLIVLDKHLLAILASHGGHVEYLIVEKNYHPRNIPAKFIFKWYGRFRAKDERVKVNRWSNDGRQVMTIFHMTLQVN